MRTKLFNAIKVSTLALLLSFGLSFVYAWTAPTISAPNGNVSAPINTSSVAQTKAGGFTVGSLITAGSATVGSLNAGTGSISTTGTLTSGSATVASLNAGSGNIDTTGNISGWNLFANSITAGATTTTNGLKVVNGASAGYVLTSDASGNGSWQSGGVAPHDKKVFSDPNANGTPTNTVIIPNGVSAVYVTAVGGGGGGGGDAVWYGQCSGTGGGGGGAGASALKNVVTVTPGANLPVVVGAGGTSGPSGTTNALGGTGGSSGLNGVFTVLGGAGGNGPWSSGLCPGIGGAGGIGNTNNLYMGGVVAGVNGTPSNGITLNAAGGWSYIGTAGSLPYGSGGNGATINTNTAGFAGKPGYVMVEW